MEAVAGWLECCGLVGQECGGHRVRAAARAARVVGRACGGAPLAVSYDEDGAAQRVWLGGGL